MIENSVGVIFDAKENGVGEGSVVIHYREPSPRPRRLKKLGTSFVIGGLIGLLLLVTPILTAEVYFRIASLRNIGANQNNIQISRFGQILLLAEQGIQVPADWKFSLIVPKLGINAKVEKSISIADEKVWRRALSSGVAHAQGSALPGESGTIYIFGHSTDYIWNISRYNALFYPLIYSNVGDEVIILFDGKQFVYRVAEKRVVEADDLDYLSQNGENRLVLQTCWPPGTTWKRLIIEAEPVNEI